MIQSPGKNGGTRVDSVVGLPATFYRICLCLLAGALGISGSLFLTGCSTPKPPSPANQIDVVQATRFWQPHLLYILDTPYPRLYVEVDAVAGCEPSDATLNKLRDFLTTYCRKPGGIEIVRNEVIPTKTAQGLSRAALVRQFLNGPPADTNTPPAAFMYLLFYDGRLCDQPPLIETTTATTRPKPSTREKEQNKKPHVDFLPYPAAAFINTRYGPKFSQPDSLLHEAGHLLDLASRSDHATNYHCLDTSCRMNSTIRIHFGRRMLLLDPIKQHNLCDYCDAQLRASAKSSAPGNLRFVGPVLVRSENGYHVLSLPFHMKLFVGNLTDADCHDFVNAVRTQIPPLEMDANAQHLEAYLQEGVASMLRQEILTRAQNDPFELVRDVATGLEAEIKRREETPRASGP